MKKLLPFLTISLNTFVEVMCVPVYLVFSAAALALIGLLPHISCFAFGEETKLVSDSVLSVAFLAGIFISAISAGISVGNEYRKKTVFLILSKPVSRTAFVLAKYAGVCMAITLFFLLTYVSGCIALKLVALAADPAMAGSGGCEHCRRTGFCLHSLFCEEIMLSVAYFGCFALAFIIGGIANFRAGRNFPFWAFVSLCILLSLLFAGVFAFSPLDEIVVFTNFGMVFFLILLALFMMSAVTVVFAMHFDILLCIIASVSVFLVGLVADYIFGGTRFLLARVIYRLLPDWQFFWMADTFSEGAGLPLGYVMNCVLYAGLFSAAVLAGGLFLDSRRDVV